MVAWRLKSPDSSKAGCKGMEAGWGLEGFAPMQKLEHVDRGHTTAPYPFPLNLAHSDVTPSLYAQISLKCY